MRMRSGFIIETPSFNLWYDLVRRGFDLCLDFTGNDRSALVSFFSKAAERIGFSFVAKRAARSWGYTHLVQSPVREKHTADHYMDLIWFREILFQKPAFRCV